MANEFEHITSREELLAELDGLTHNARMTAMVGFGRRAATDPAAAAVVAALERGRPYERRLAVQSCAGSRDGAHLLRALADPSRLVSGLAAWLAPDVCDDAQVLTALAGANLAARRKIIVRLHRRGRQATIEAFLTRLADQGHPDLVRLLPYGSGRLVAQHLDRYPDAAAADWSKLANWDPAAAADAMERRAAGAGGHDARLAWQAHAVLAVLADRLPDRAVALARALGRHAPVGRLHLAPLVRRRPNEVADLVLADDTGPSVRFGAVAHRLDPERLLALAERRGAALGPPELYLKRLPPTLRARLYALCERGWRDADGAVRLQVLERLPAEVRRREARRHLALPALATRPAQRLPYASLLPWDEARGVLDPFVRNPDAALRALALAALVTSVRFERERLGDLLALVLARKNEQDPVRLAILAALAGLPPGRWRAEHLDDLGRVIRQAVDASDASPATTAQAERIVVRLLPFQPDWSAQWLATLVRERGQVSLYAAGVQLTDADVRRIAPALRPVLESWQTREREPQLLDAATYIGRRLRVFDALADMLENVIYEAAHAWNAERALGLLAGHRRDRFARLVPALLAKDPSWVTRPTVYDHLHRRQQDLLTPFLGRQVFRGRFSTGRTRFVLPLTDGFYRWTPAQQAAFAKTLTELTRDAERDTPAVLGAVVALAALPDVPPDRIVVLADAGNTKQAVRDAAVRALGRLDEGRGVTTLLDAMADDRARIAIYALRRSLLDMPVARAVALLRRVPMGKVTVAKEVVRLLGDMASDEAYDHLLSLDRADLHRDVRVALLRAL